MPSPRFEARGRGRRSGLAPQRCSGAAAAARPLSERYGRIRAMCGGAEATPGPPTASTKPLCGESSEQGFGRYLTDVSRSWGNGGGAAESGAAAAPRRRWGARPMELTLPGDAPGQAAPAPGSHSPSEPPSANRSPSNAYAHLLCAGWDDKAQQRA